MSKSKMVVYIGVDANGVWTPDGIHFPYGEAVSVPTALADSLLMQDTFTDRMIEDGEGSEAS